MTVKNETENTPLRVYPMGFVPELKRRLLKYAESDLKILGTLYELSEEIQKAVQSLNSNDQGIEEVFEPVRVLAQGIQDGLKVSQQEQEFVTHTLRTDEELAVIFAKISRNPGSFQEISRSVTEEGAANFHKRWVVSVEGYGHASVAEHAIVHLAVENTPSLDGDELTDNRLGSYTEFSARFKGRQDVGYFVPEAVKKDKQLSRLYGEIHNKLFTVHDNLFEKGKVYIATEEAMAKHPERRVKDKTVADQVKNLMPASRLTSIGVTMNAREVENGIRKLVSSPHESVRNLGEAIKEASLQVAPTLVKYAEANEYISATRNGVAKMVQEERFRGYIPEMNENGRAVDLIGYDSQADERFVAAALYARHETGSFRDLMHNVSMMRLEEKREVIADLLRMGRFDVPIRALEFPGDYLAEINHMTYGDWREWKRHRMESYQAKELHVQWGYMIPPLVKEMDEASDEQYQGGVVAIKDVMGDVEDLFNKVAKVDPYAAQYVVTRLHYRPAMVKMNLREAYHFTTLRTGPTAHPFIRRLAWPFFDEIRSVNPLLMESLQLRLHREGRPGRDYTWTY